MAGQTRNFSNHDSGFQYNQVGDGGQYNQTGSGTQYNTINQHISPDSLENKCLQALCFADLSHHMDQIKNLKDELLEDCYIWILDDESLRGWQEDANCRLLWMSGDPGKGKTMLMISLVEHLSKSLDQSTPLSFFFCQSTDARFNTSAAVLRGLIWRLAHKNPSLIKYVREEYEHASEDVFEGQGAFFTLRSILLNILRYKTLPTVYLLVDALDECNIGRKDLLKFIIETASSSSVDVKWLVSSRNHLDIKEVISVANNRRILSLELNDKHVGQAVEFFIKYKAKKLTELKNYKAELYAQVKRFLSEKANATFLWVALVCKELEDVEDYDVLDVLREMPSGLMALYERMVRHIMDLKRSEPIFCQKILATVAVALRPLLILELYRISGVSHKVSEDPEQMSKLIQKCGSFLTIRKNYVYFVHQSAKDYLVMGEMNHTNTFAEFRSTMQNAHTSVYQKSMNAMSKILRKDMCTMETSSAQICQPKLTMALESIGYACCFWVEHLILSLNNSNDVKTDLADNSNIHEFFLKYFLHWVEALGWLGQIRAGTLALQRLSGQITEHDSSLNNFIRDATRATLQCRTILEKAPLQTYSSMLIFAPKTSIIKYHFWEQIKWLKELPRVQEQWTVLQHTLEAHDSYVLSVAYSPDGKQLASSSSDKKIILWDTETGVRKRILTGHTDDVNSVTFSLDGELLVSGSSDKTIKLWDPEVGALLRTIRGHTKDVSSVAFSCNGRLASASDDKTIRLWDSHTGELQQILKGHEEPVQFVTFSSDGKLLASSSHNLVIAWDVDTGTLIRTLYAHRGLSSIAFSADNTYLAVASKALVLLLKVETGQIQQTFEGHADSITSVSFSPDDKQLASASIDTTVRIWDIDKGIIYRTLTGPKAAVSSVAYTHGWRLASGSFDKKVQLWDTEIDTEKDTNTQYQTIDERTSVSSLKFSHDSKMVVSTALYTISLWDVRTGTLLHTFNKPEGGLYDIPIAFSPNCKLMASGGGESIYIWDTDTGSMKSLSLRDQRHAVDALAFSPNSKLLASISRGSELRYWNLETEEHHMINRDTENDEPMVFSLDGKRLNTPSGFYELRLSEDEVNMGMPEEHYEQHPQELRSVTPEVDHSALPGWGVSKQKDWITWNTQNVLWIPYEYRPTCVAVGYQSIALSCHLGLVYIINFTDVEYDLRG